MENKDILQQDLYTILDIQPNASKEQIRKAFRRMALIYHPDKNDSPDAASKFVHLKKILEILLDSDSKTHYDKLLRGRKEAEIRARNLSAETQSFKKDLERREKEVEEAKQRKKEDKERINQRNRRIAENEQRRMDEELEREDNARRQELDRRKQEQAKQDDHFRCVKAKWKRTTEWEGFTKEEIERIFYKFGDMDACVMMEKGTKALIEFKEKSAADMAVLYETGLPGKEIKVSYFGRPKKGEKRKRSTDTESIYEMNQRRAKERQKIMEDMRAMENIDS